MTVIAAAEDATHVWMATDSLGSYGNLKIEFGSKIIPKTNYVLSNAGSYRVGDIVEECDEFPKNIKNLKDLRKFRDTLYGLILNDEFAFKPRNEDLYANVEIIIVSPYGIFTVEDDFQIHKIEVGYHTAGTGEELARGALYTCRKMGLKAEAAVKHGCEAAIKHCLTCGGDIHYAFFKKPA